MSQINDCRFDACRALGYTGEINDMLLQWAHGEGAPTTEKDVNLAVRSALRANGAASGDLNDAWFEALRAAGYTGSRQEMWKQFWCVDGGAFSLANLPLTSSLFEGKGTFESFTRGTAASVTDFEGVVRQVKPAEVRFDRARRVENLCQHQDFRDFSIVSTGATVEGNIDDPFGGSEAYRLTTPATISVASFRDQFTNTLLRDVKGSVWVRYISGNGLLNGFLLYRGDSTNQNFHPDDWSTYQNEWIRISVDEARVAASTTFNFGVDIFHSGQVVFDVYGLQYEDITGQENTAPAEFVSVETGTEQEEIDLEQANWDVSNPRWSHDGTKLQLSIGAGDATTHYASYAASEFVSTDGRLYEFKIDIENFVETGTLGKTIELWSSFATQTNFNVEGKPSSFTLRAVQRADNTGIGVFDSVYIGAVTGSPGDTMSFDVVSVSIREIKHGANVDGVKYFKTFNLNYDGDLVGPSSTARKVETAPTNLQMLANPEFDIDNTLDGTDNTDWEWTGIGTMQIRNGVATQIGNFATGRQFYQDALNKQTWVTIIPRGNIKGLVFKFEYRINTGVLDVTDPTPIRIFNNVSTDIYGNLFSTATGVDHVYYVAPATDTNIGDVVEFNLTQAGVDPNLEIEYVRMTVANELPVGNANGTWQELARTNLHNNSENSAATWVALASVQETGQTRVTPVGIKSNPRWVLNTISSTHGVFGTTAATGGVTVTNLANVVISGMIKSDQRYIGIVNGLVIPQTKATFDTQTKQFLNLGSAVVQASYMELNDGWWHIFVHYANVANTNAFPYMLCSNINDVSTAWTPAGTEYIEVMGVQVEDSVAHPSTYIQSDAGAATTRNQELLDYDLGAIAANEDYQNIVGSMFPYWTNLGASFGSFALIASDYRDANNYDIIAHRNAGANVNAAYAFSHGGFPGNGFSSRAISLYEENRNSVSTDFDRTPITRRLLAHDNGVEYSALNPLNTILISTTRTLQVSRFGVSLNGYGPIKDLKVFNKPRSEAILISESTP